jgi:predicted small metal-binding protein
LLRKPDVLEKLKHHFQEEHGLRPEDGETSHEVSPISQTIDKLRSRIKVTLLYTFTGVLN